MQTCVHQFLKRHSAPRDDILVHVPHSLHCPIKGAAGLSKGFHTSTQQAAEEERPLLIGSVVL